MFDGFSILAIDQHLYSLAEKRRANFALFQAEHALLAGNIGYLNQFINAFTGVRQAEFERSSGHFEGAEKLVEAEFRQHNQHGATDHNQYGGGIDKNIRRHAKNDG